jgi:hypothetical protein
VIGGVLVDTIGARGTLLFAGAATALIGLLGCPAVVRRRPTRTAAHIARAVAR